MSHCSRMLRQSLEPSTPSCGGGSAGTAGRYMTTGAGCFAIRQSPTLAGEMLAASEWPRQMLFASSRSRVGDSQPISICKERPGRRRSRRTLSQCGGGGSGSEAPPPPNSPTPPTPPLGVVLARADPLAFNGDKSGAVFRPRSQLWGISRHRHSQPAAGRQSGQSRPSRLLQFLAERPRPPRLLISHVRSGD
jgi:hypothetical protein